MDIFARGLLCASKLLDDGVFPALVKKHYSMYSSLDSGIGRGFHTRSSSLGKLSNDEADG